MTEELTENLLSAEEILFNDILSTEAIKNVNNFLNFSTILCPELKNNINLHGHLGQATLLIEDLTESEIQDFNPNISNGGKWKPTHCRARHKVSFY